jgi:hypothetical protein
MPIALTNIGWKTYMINGAWDIVMLASIIYWWVETKGKPFEKIDEAFEGTKHSDVPDLEEIYKGRESVGDFPVLEVNEIKS